MKRKIEKQKELDVNIDFDEASKCWRENKKVGIINTDFFEIMGINTISQLRELEENIRNKNKNEIKNYYNI